MSSSSENKRKRDASALDRKRVIKERNAALSSKATPQMARDALDREKASMASPSTPPPPATQTPSQIGDVEGPFSELALYAIKWIETAIYVDDKGTRMRLAPYQIEIIRDIYELNPDGSRKIDSIIISVGRKNGKSSLAAAIICLEMTSKFAPSGAWFACAAGGNREQSKIIWRMVRTYIERNPKLKARYRIAEDAGRIVNTSNFNTLMALSTSARSAQGYEFWGHSFDELAQARTNDLLNAIEMSGRSKSNGTKMIVSTNSTLPGNPLNDKIDTIRQAQANGQMMNWKLYVYAADLKEMDIWSDEALLAANPGLKANPPLIDWDVLEHDRIQAQHSPKERADYVAYRLNASTGNKEAICDAQSWADLELTSPLDEMLDKVKHHPCILSVDLSRSVDLTAVMLFWPHNGFCLNQGWLPGSKIESLEILDKQPYRYYEQEGWLRLSKGRTVDYEDVALYIIEMMEKWDVREVRYDPWGWSALKAHLKNNGVDDEHPDFLDVFRPVRQGYITFTPLISELERRIQSNELIHIGDPVLTSAMMQMRIESSPNTATDARRPAKSNANSRIDSAVALLMCMDPPVEELPPSDPVPSHFLSLIKSRGGMR